ncbi:MAG TPA: PAS domain S-box protein, partial [Thermoanaerobaculia bacterium]|nr:PAS domain S-box protein [Thermoanaerobaculia bacterium]
MPPRRVPLAKVVAATLVAVTTVLLGTYFIISYQLDAKRQWDVLRRLTEAQANELSVALALPVWNIDRPQIERVIEAMSQPHSVYGIRVQAAGGTYGRVRDSQWNLVPWNEKSVPKDMLVEERPIAFAGNPIGTVRLLVTPRFTLDELHASLIRMASTVVGADVLLILCIYFVLWRTVVRPLVQIERYAVAVGGGSAAAMTAGRGFPAELESLRSCIETMVDELTVQVAQRTESEARFRSIFDAVSDAIMINDIDSGAVIEVNETMCTMFGYTADELKRIDAGSVSGGGLPFTTKKALEVLQRVADGEEKRYEWPSKHRDGHLFWTEVNLHAATIGGRKRAIVVVRDITQRKQMEDALKEEQELTEAAIDSITGVFLVQDREGRFIRWNDTMERLSGGEQLLRNRVGRPLVYPDDRDYVERKIDEVFDLGHAELETRMIIGEEVKNYLFNARRMDVRGRSFLVATGTDITERRHAEAEQLRLQNEIERSAAEWKATFDTVTTPILITERSGVIVRVNRAALELSGLSDEQIAGRPIEEISASEPWQTAAQLISYIAGKRRGTTAETKDAEGRTWDIIVSHFSTPNDGSERFILVLWEITGIVELQESLRRSETLSAMGTLVAGVAHEVRNPLFGISATLDAFHEEMSQPGYAECGATLRQEVNRLIHLMQELLEYGKPPALTIERGNIHEVVRYAVESRRAAAHAAGVEIRNDVTSGMPTLLMDRSRLWQVFENLIDNAVQHSESGGTVRVSGDVVEHAGRHWVECLVEDEGPGFAPHDLDRVFEPFFTQRQGGTGLGLSI